MQQPKTMDLVRLVEQDVSALGAVDLPLSLVTRTVDTLCTSTDAINALVMARAILN